MLTCYIVLCRYGAVISYSVFFLLSDNMELEKIVKHLYDSLSFKLGISPQKSLSEEFLLSISR